MSRAQIPSRRRCELVIIPGDHRLHLVCKTHGSDSPWVLEPGPVSLTELFMMICPAGRLSPLAPYAYEHVMALIKTGMNDGTFPPGSRLPGEYELAAQTGHSRPTVRQALETLHEAGLIRPVAHVGWFVKSAEPS